MIRSQLFFIDGTSGIWKQDLITFVQKTCSNAEVVKKFSTRPLRSGETISDILQVEAGKFTDMHLDCTYQYSGHSYGFSKAHIRQLLLSKDRVYLIVRNFDLLRQLRKEFAEYRPITVFIYSAPNLIAQRLGKAAEAQKAAIDVAFHDYLRHPEIYDHVVLNGGSYDDFCRIMDNLKAEAATETDLQITATEKPLTLQGVFSRYKSLPLAEALKLNGVFIGVISSAFALGMWVHNLQAKTDQNAVVTEKVAIPTILSTPTNTVQKAP